MCDPTHGSISKPIRRITPKSLSAMGSLKRTASSLVFIHLSHWTSQGLFGACREPPAAWVLREPLGSAMRRAQLSGRKLAGTPTQQDLISDSLINKAHPIQPYSSACKLPSGIGWAPARKLKRAPKLAPVPGSFLGFRGASAASLTATRGTD